MVRDRCEDAVESLGPFAALISRIIKKRSTKRNESKIVGPFTVYRGISLPARVVEQWKAQSEIVLEGYSSSSMNEGIAKYFAYESTKDGLEENI